MSFTSYSYSANALKYTYILNLIFVMEFGIWILEAGVKGLYLVLITYFVVSPNGDYYREEHLVFY